MTPRNVEHSVIFKHPEHCVNQIAMRLLRNGELAAVYNEERFPMHHDSGQTLLVRSRDGGKTWSEPKIVLPYSDTEGNWDCGICELSDGTLIVNLTVTGYFKRGISPAGVSWSSYPMTEEWGDWTWAYKTQSWLGTYVLRSTDNGETWSKPISVNLRPMKHGGCRLGCWEMPNGSLLLGLYGRIRGYDDYQGDDETTRCFLVRSDDGGLNWEYYSTLAYDPANIIVFWEPAILRLKDGRMVCFLRAHTRPAIDAQNMMVCYSDDDGFSWSRPRLTNIWGYPPEAIALRDGRYLLVYGYRRPPYGVRGCISEDGISWDKKNEFVIREGGVPGANAIEGPGSYRMGPEGGKTRAGSINWGNPGVYQHIGYPTVQQLPDGTIAVAYHEWSNDPKPLQYLLCTRFTI